MEKSRREYSGQGGNEGRPWTHLLPQAPKLQLLAQKLSMRKTGSENKRTSIEKDISKKPQWEW